ncbi:20385_t:CDS:2 [Funneliformis geosporum]|nr:20385_t:CDS:2 [Funneliformis geosporum]
MGRTGPVGKEINYQTTTLPTGQFDLDKPQKEFWVGENVILVPYRPEHVPKYHEWMQSPFLREMTASEPLTLEQEYEMQRSWHVDENILAKPEVSHELTNQEIKSAKMIGDVNLFFNDSDNPSIAEIEIMIAAKISTNNQPSIQLFTRKFDFVEMSFSNIFNEHSLELVANEEIKKKVDDSMRGKFVTRSYD